MQSTHNSQKTILDSTATVSCYKISFSSDQLVTKQAVK